MRTKEKVRLADQPGRLSVKTKSAHPDRLAAETYANRAEELRAIASEMRGEARKTLLSVAEDYDRLAATRLRMAKSDERRSIKNNKKRPSD